MSCMGGLDCLGTDSREGLGLLYLIVKERLSDCDRTSNAKALTLEWTPKQGPSATLFGLLWRWLWGVHAVRGLLQFSHYNGHRAPFVQYCYRVRLETGLMLRVLFASNLPLWVSLTTKRSGRNMIDNMSPELHDPVGLDISRPPLWVKDQSYSRWDCCFSLSKVFIISLTPLTGRLYGVAPYSHGLYVGSKFGFPLQVGAGKTSLWFPLTSGFIWTTPRIAPRLWFWGEEMGLEYIGRRPPCFW